MQPPHKILIIEDDAIMGEVLSDILTDAGYRVAWAANSVDAFDEMAKEAADVVLIDLLLPGLNGLEILKQLMRSHPHCVKVMMSGHGSIQSAVEATRIGAYEWMEKPLEKERVLLTVRNAVERQRLESRNTRLLSEIRDRYQMIGHSPHLKQIYDMIDRVAPTPTTVLITGESGTGKDLVARALHINSLRADSAMVQVNCAAVPDTLIESELFGHVKGAFTGAISSKRGKFQQADGGTLFLDEVGDLSPMAQAKVLRAIESGEVAPIGTEKSENVDVRLIAATNKNLREAVQNGTFREDLYHRIQVIEIALHPLRERTVDIPPLLNHFLERYASQSGRQVKQLTPDAMAYCMSYSWPGNVREVRNLAEKIGILVDNESVTLTDILPLLAGEAPAPVKRPSTLKEAKRHFEKTFIEKNLQANNWNIAHTAELLAMPRSLLYQKIDRYGLQKKS